MKIPNSKFQIPHLKLKILAFCLLFSVLPSFIFGAVLYLDPKEGEYGLKDHFGIKIRIDPEGECINTISVDLSFPNDTLIFEGADFGDSIVTIWVERPSSLDN